MKKPKNAGKYNKKIIIARSENADVGGFVNVKAPDKLITVLECWAEVQGTSGYTLIKSHTDWEKAVTRFRIRMPRIEIDRSMFVLYRDRIFSIKYVNPVDDSELELQAEAVTK